MVHLLFQPADVYANLGQLFNWIDATVFVWTGDHLTPWAPVEPCKQDPAKGCATCRPAPNQNKCATCTNPAYIVNAAGKASGVQSWHAQPVSLCCKAECARALCMSLMCMSRQTHFVYSACLQNACILTLRVLLLPAVCACSLPPGYRQE